MGPKYEGTLYTHESRSPPNVALDHCHAVLYSPPNAHRITCVVTSFVTCGLCDTGALSRIGCGQPAHSGKHLTYTSVRWISVEKRDFLVYFNCCSTPYSKSHRGCSALLSSSAVPASYLLESTKTDEIWYHGSHLLASGYSNI